MGVGGVRVLGVLEWVLGWSGWSGCLGGVGVGGVRVGVGGVRVGVGGVRVLGVLGCWGC